MKDIQYLSTVIPIGKINENEIKKTLSDLSKDEQQILQLFYEKKKGIKEIAVAMNCSVSTVNTKLNRVLFMLKNRFNPSAFDKAYSILYPETGKPGNPSLFL